MEDENTAFLELAEVIEIERKKGRPKKDDKNIPVPISMSKELRNAIDELSPGNRSKFVCEAIKEKMKKVN